MQRSGSFPGWSMELLAFTSRRFAPINIIIWVVCSVAFFLVSERSGRKRPRREALVPIYQYKYQYIIRVPWGKKTNWGNTDNTSLEALTSSLFFGRCLTLHPCLFVVQNSVKSIWTRKNKKYLVFNNLNILWNGGDEKQTLYMYASLTKGSFLSESFFLIISKVWQ